MIWLSHKKYTEEYLSGQLVEICTKVRRETRRMIYVATGATALMVMLEAGYLYDLLAI